MNIRNEKHERERNDWMKSCQNHVRILTDSQRVGEDLDAEVKKLRRTLESKNRKLADAMKQPEKEAASPPNELQDSQIQLTEPKSAQNLDDLEDGERQNIAKALVRLFVKHAEQAQNQGTMSLSPGQITDAIALRLGLQVEHDMYRNFWGEAEVASQAYRDNFMAVHFYLEGNSGLLDRLLNGSLLPEALSSMSEDEMSGAVKVMEIVGEQRTGTQMGDSTVEQASRTQDSRRVEDGASTQEGIQVECDHDKDNDEHQSAHHSVLSEGHGGRAGEQNEEEYQAKSTGIGEEEDEGIGGIPSSREPSNDNHDNQAKPNRTFGSIGQNRSGNEVGSFMGDTDDHNGMAESQPDVSTTADVFDSLF